MKVFDGFLKESFDVLLSLILLTLMLPLFLVVAFLIALESGLPVFFAHERVGYMLEPFWMVKFRTMVRGASKHKLGIYTVKGDPRETRVGRFLRRWVIDEMPQLWNVLRGEMSVVGPRPMTWEIASRFPKDVLVERHSVKPGITGWAQLHGRSSLPWEERVRYDLEYVRHRNFLWDVYILLVSFSLLKGEGIYYEQPELKGRGEGFELDNGS